MTCSTALAWMASSTPQLLDHFSLLSFTLGVAGTLVVLWLVFRRRTVAHSVSIGLPFGLGSATFDLTSKDRIAAWKLHIQLVTRKAALPFDQKDDVVADVFASLFELFQVTRDLLLELPPSNSNDQHGVAGLIIRVLNMGIRPTLTRWHADYRRWWEAALQLPANAGRPPQEIQRDYPRYPDLVADLGRMNIELSKFSDQLALVAAGASPRNIAHDSVTPQAPALAESAGPSNEDKDENPPPSEPNPA